MPNSEMIIAKERKALMKLMDEGPFKIPSRRVDGNIIIATWNIQQFTNNKSRRALQYMADICERFDLIALQEIKTDLRGLSRLQALLPGNYRILVCDPTGNSERFAFLYDKRTVIPTGWCARSASTFRRRRIGDISSTGCPIVRRSEPDGSISLS